MPVEWGITRWVGPAAIVLLALNYILLFLALLSYTNSRRFPVVLLVLIWIYLSSFLNNNRAIRTIQAPICSENIQQNFSAWLKLRKAELKDSTQRVPVIIVAAEGGGIRALNWTARVLNTLDNIEGFTDHVYAISGVSGGAVGGAIYTSWLYDKKKKISKPDSTDSLHFENIISADYLSPVTAAYLFADNIQMFIPAPIHPFDRARWLEDSWSSTYYEEAGYHTLDSGLCRLYCDSTVKHSIPNLFINGTLAETGQKVITSNLRLDRFFPDVLDVLNYVKRDVPVKTAALLSARFPYVTPGGLIDNGDDSCKKFYGHIVDGGYHENTGIETAIEILNSVKTQAAIDNISISPIVLFIKNSSIPDSSSQALGALFDLRTPPSAFINAWSRQGFPYFPYTDALCRYSRDKIHFKKIELTRDNATAMRLPLGWYLSDSANAVIQKYENELTDKTVSGNAISDSNRVVIKDIIAVLKNSQD